MACIEADESDGTCVNYRPSIGVITGFARDHKESAELHQLYSAFAGNTRQALVLSAQAAASLFGLPAPRRVTFGLREGDVRARNIRLGARDVSFQVGTTRFRLRQIGAYSVFNALASIAALRELGLSDGQIEAGLRSFEGIAPAHGADRPRARGADFRRLRAQPEQDRGGGRGGAARRARSACSRSSSCTGSGPRGSCTASCARRWRGR